MIAEHRSGLSGGQMGAGDVVMVANGDGPSDGWMARVQMELVQTHPGT